jgi:hypothetical protein
MAARALFPFLFLGLAGGAAAQGRAVGVYGLWGAFAEKNRCYAIAEPQRTIGNNPRGAFASVGWWPDRRVGGQVHFRMSHVKRQGSAVLLRIDERTFQLVGGGDNAWAPDPRADADIVAAMRIGVQMTIETRSERGALVRDLYALRGAASAVDAAAIACARRS